MSPELLEMWRDVGGASDTAQTGRSERIERDGRLEAGSAKSAGRGMDVDVRALQFVRQLIYEREEVPVAELAHELRQRGLELTGKGTGLEEALQFLSDNGYAGDGYAGSGQWLIGDVVRRQGSGTVTERVVMLI